MKEGNTESEKEHVEENEEEMEEGQLNENWSGVAVGKISRSPVNLKYGQVQLLTPSRYALLEVDENGEPLHQIEIEEVLSVGEEIVEGNSNKEKGKDATRDITEAYKILMSTGQTWQVLL
ncbi:hypothetical protein DY000_02053331 [Brassica cretica]|uniref:Uncharacterized protein n=1 Tax=Brassica cretica TaxID=69181 RepID=A0ABQ7AKF4_BRACR|nr:hypothetical protein DY000_02053331 [Brassica cretica]